MWRVLILLAGLSLAKPAPNDVLHKHCALVGRRMASAEPCCWHWKRAATLSVVEKELLGCDDRPDPLESNRPGAYSANPGYLLAERGAVGPNVQAAGGIVLQASPDPLSVQVAQQVAHHFPGGFGATVNHESGLYGSLVSSRGIVDSPFNLGKRMSRQKPSFVERPGGPYGVPSLRRIKPSTVVEGKLPPLQIAPFPFKPGPPPRTPGQVLASKTGMGNATGGKANAIRKRKIS